MPLVNHVAFVLSFVSTFACLYISTSYAGAWLRARGWDVSDIILIGLEKKNFSDGPPPKMLSFEEVVNTVKADKSAQVAVACGIATIVFLLSRLISSSALSARGSRLVISLLTILCPSPLLGRKPVLNPSEWKEFPLVAKFTVSPNTALCVSS